MQVKVSLCRECGQVVWEPRLVEVDPGEAVQWENSEGQELAIDFKGSHPFDKPNPPFKAAPKGATPVAHVKLTAERGKRFPCTVSVGGIQQALVEGVIIRPGNN